jgi:hypothetical protein
MTTALIRRPTFSDGAPPPIDIQEGGGGGGSSWVQLTRAANDIEASLMRGRLNEAGVESTAVKDRSGPSWLFGGSDQWAPVAIMVRRLQLNDARLVLAEIAYDQPSFSPDPYEADGPDRRTTVLFWAVALALGTLLTGVALAKTGAAMNRCDLPLICVEGGVEGR